MASYTSGSTTSANGMDSVPCYSAGYIYYRTPSSPGKWVIETTSGAYSPDYYSYLSTSALSAGSGDSRTGAVSGSILTTDDDGADTGYDTRISYICNANTYYRWYVNGDFSSSGTYNIPWKFKYWYRRTLTYNNNGGSGGPGSQYFYGDASSVTLSNTKPTRSNYTFLGWSTSSSATNASYQPGARFPVSDANYTLYAVWKLNTVTLSYNANGGTGAPNSEQVTPNTSHNVNFSTIPTRTNYTFKGWSKSSTATTPTYKPGGTTTISISSNTTLYAVWWPVFSWTTQTAAQADVLISYIFTYIG